MVVHIECMECGHYWADENLVEISSEEGVNGRKVLRKLVLEMEKVLELCGPRLDVVACNVNFSVAEFQQLRRLVEVD